MSNGKCAHCGENLESNYHGDHIEPYSKGGKTELFNGQALCASCNIKKGDNENVVLRTWQKEFIKHINSIKSKGDKTYLLHAGVGSGKTLAATYFASQLVRDGWSVIICSPSVNIKNAWAKEFQKFGIDSINNRYAFINNFRHDGYKGISITYQSLGENNIDLLTNQGTKIVNEKTLLILDEVHHIGKKQSWGNSIEAIGDKCGFILMLTGTPTRSDDNRIPFAEYDLNYNPKSTKDKHKLKVNMSYSYGDSVRDGICCPISFRDVEIKADGVNGCLDDSPQSTKILNDALTVRANNYVMEMVEEAGSVLDDLRYIKEDAGGLIVCNSIKDAEDLSEKLDDCVLVTSKEEDGDVKINEFANSNKKWIVSVNKISEGVNIPRIRVIVYAKNYDTMLFFQQVAGRGVRNRNDDGMDSIDHCFFYYPKYQPFVNNAKEIEDEINHIVDLQKEKPRPPKPPIKPVPDPCELEDFMDVYAGSVGIINGGMTLDRFKKILEQLPRQDSMIIERALALNMSDMPRQNTATGNDVKEPLLKVDRVKLIKDNIQDVCKRIAKKLCNGFVGSSEYAAKVRYVQNEINKSIGCFSRLEIHNEKKLEEALAFANNWLNKLK